MSRVSELARLLSLVLANPGAVVDGPADGLSPTDRLARLAPMLLVILCAGAALFGAAVGSHRGGIQALYAAMKMPLVFLLPGMVALPAIRVIAGGPHPCGHARASLAAAVGMARAAALAAAVAPIVWLVFTFEVDYRAAVLILIAGLLLAGLPGLTCMMRSISGTSRAVLPSLSAVCLIGIVMAQTGWLLRPFVVSPDAQVTLFCPISQDVFTGVAARISGSDLYLGSRPADCSPSTP